MPAAWYVRAMSLETWIGLGLAIGVAYGVIREILRRRKGD